MQLEATQKANKEPARCPQLENSSREQRMAGTNEILPTGNRIPPANLLYERAGRALRSSCSYPAHARARWLLC